MSEVDKAVTLVNSLSSIFVLRKLNLVVSLFFVPADELLDLYLLVAARNIFNHQIGAILETLHDHLRNHRTDVTTINGNYIDFGVLDLFLKVLC